MNNSVKQQYTEICLLLKLNILVILNQECVMFEGLQELFSNEKLQFPFAVVPTFPQSGLFVISIQLHVKTCTLIYTNLYLTTLSNSALSHCNCGEPLQHIEGEGISKQVNQGTHSPHFISKIRQSPWIRMTGLLVQLLPYIMFCLTVTV